MNSSSSSQVVARDSIIKHQRTAPVQQPAGLLCCWLFVGDASAAPAVDSDSFTSVDSSSSVEDEAADRLQQAVEVVAEMQLTSEQLKVSVEHVLGYTRQRSAGPRLE